MHCATLTIPDLDGPDPGELARNEGVLSQIVCYEEQF
jgi:hypothetical protein